MKNDNDVLSGTLSILNGVAIGKNAVISVGADNSIAIGHNARVDHHNSFVWNGSNKENYIYESKGDHTFNINPAAGLCGIYVGEKTLCSLISIDTALSI